MDTMTATAASGLRSRMESLDLLANNIANASTGGYKADREFYSLYVGADASDNDVLATMPVIQKNYVDHSQGALQHTGNPLDIALQGKGFIGVNGPAGPLYTRNGNLRISSASQLTTSDGYTVRDTAGTPLTVQPGGGLAIAGDGTVTQNGNTIGKLDVVDFTSNSDLTKQGANYFRVADPSVTPTAPASTTVEQGNLESSNTGTAESAVRLVSVMRQFEMLQKAVSIGADMNKRAIEDVAKV
jgi:flagellar basal-body rod protein FlgF